MEFWKLLMLKQIKCLKMKAVSELIDMDHGGRVSKLENNLKDSRVISKAKSYEKNNTIIEKIYLETTGKIKNQIPVQLTQNIKDILENHFLNINTVTITALGIFSFPFFSSFRQKFFKILFLITIDCFF